MTHRRFFTQLLLVITLTGLVLFALLNFKPFDAYVSLSGILLAFFAMLTTGVYIAASKAALSKDKNAFTRLVMICSFVKMFMAILVVVVYHKFLKPQDNYFLIPFFLIYIVFTVFETALMSKLGKVKPV